MEESSQEICTHGGSNYWLAGLSNGYREVAFSVLDCMISVADYKEE